MKEFTIREKKIIKEKLLTGSMLVDLFSAEFTDNARLEISIDTNEEHHIFNYYSDSYDAAQATEELYDLVKLLNYLEENDLVNKYHPPATSMSDFEIIDNITIGKSQSENRSKFIMPFGSSGKVVFYLYKNLYHTFRATESLRSLVKHNYTSVEERQQRTANWIAGGSLLSAIIAILISIYQGAAINDLKSDIDKNESEIQSLRGRLKNDSVQNIASRSKILELESQVGVLRSAFASDSIRKNVIGKKK